MPVSQGLRILVLVQAECFDEPLECERIAESDDGVLIGKHAFLPDRLLLRQCLLPVDSYEVLGQLLVIGTVAHLRRSQWSIEDRNPVAVHVDLEGLDSLSRLQDFADGDVAGLRDVDEDARAREERLETLRVPLAAASRDEAVPERIFPGTLLVFAEGDVEVLSIPWSARRLRHVWPGGSFGAQGIGVPGPSKKLMLTITEVLEEDHVDR